MNALVRAPLAVLILAATPAASLGQDGAEAFLPEDAILYMGSADLDAFIAETKSKAMGKIFEEEEVQDFLEKPFGMAQQYIEMGMAMAAQEPQLAGLDPMKILSGPYGNSFMALTHLDLPQSLAGDPDIGLVIGLEAKQGGLDVFTMALEMANTLASEEGVNVEVEERSVGDRSYTRTRFDGEGPPLCFAKIRGTSVMSLSDKSMTGMLERANDSAKSLKTSAEFAKASAVVGASSNGSPTMFMNTGRMMELADQGMVIASNFASGEEAAALVMAKQALAASGFLDAGVTMMRAGWEGDVAVTRSYVEMGGQPIGLAAALDAVRGPVETKMIKWVPKTAQSFSLYNMNFAPVYDTAMGMLKQFSPEIHAQAIMGMQGFAAQMGGVDADGNPLWDIRRDFIGAIGGPGMSMSVPGAASAFGPGNDMVFFIRCPNPEGLQKSLDILLGLPGELAGFPLMFQEEVHRAGGGAAAAAGSERAITMKTLDPSSLGPAAALAASIQPTYAIAHERIYLGSSPDALKGLFDRMLNPPAENITAKKDFARLFESTSLGDETKLMSLSYSDTASGFEGIYNTMLGVIPMAMLNLPVSQDDLPIEMSLLPTAEAISQHLFGTASWSYKTDTGEQVMETRGPFGAEMYLAGGALGTLGALAYTWISGEVAPEFMDNSPFETSPLINDPTDIAYQDLRDISAAITVYSVEFGSPPANLGELVKPKPAYPNGVLPRDGLPADPWGNGYSYLTDGGGGYLLWSHGPNGTDEKGGGDDLKIDRR